MSTALVPAAITGLDKATQETAVTQYLTTARERLSLALEATGPQAVADLRAEIATAAEATKQLGLSRDIQMDAQEMVRRAEYALAKAIRKGQEEGTVARSGDAGSRFAAGATRSVHGTDLASPSDFAKDVELYDRPSQGKTGILSFADKAKDDETFDAALTKAKAEGNLSRANVARKIQGKGPAPVVQRLDQIADLAASGHTSGQIARTFGVVEEYVRRIARENHIDIPADRVMRGTRRLDHTRFINETVMALEGLASGLDVLDLSQVDHDQIGYWSTSLTDSLRALNRLARQIKEMDQ